MTPNPPAVSLPVEPEQPSASLRSETSAPYAIRQRVAQALLVVAVAGLAISAIAQRWLPDRWWLESLIHAFEGALVGGICDWFAVVKTYREVEANRDLIADEIGGWVAGELLCARVIQKKIDEVLQDEALRSSLLDGLDRKLGTVENTRELLLKAWERMEPSVIDFVVDYDLSDSDLGATRGLFENDLISATIRKCFGEALVHVSNTREMAWLVEEVAAQVGPVARLGIRWMDVPRRLEVAGRNLSDVGASDHELNGDRELMLALLQVGTVGAQHYIASWNELSREERYNAASAFVLHLREPVIEAIARLVVEERDALRRVAVLEEYGPVRLFFRVLRQVVNDDLSSRIGDVVTSSLRQTPAREFRRNLEFQTRKHLELIRINGTALGFVVGGVIGLALYLLSGS